jgi:hypothetical protein
MEPSSTITMKVWRRFQSKLLLGDPAVSATGVGDPSPVSLSSLISTLASRKSAACENAANGLATGSHSMV